MTFVTIALLLSSWSATDSPCRSFTAAERPPGEWVVQMNKPNEIEILDRDQEGSTFYVLEPKPEGRSWQWAREIDPLRDDPKPLIDGEQVKVLQLFGTLIINMQVYVPYCGD